MAKSLLKFIVKIVMTLLTVVKFLMDKNVERKFYKYSCLSNIACSRNKTNFRKKIEKRCLSIKEAFYPHFSVLSSFQRFIPISAFYPHFSVLSPFQFPFSVSVSAIQFQRFIPTRFITELITNRMREIQSQK